MDYLVTEYGIATLRGKSLRQRAQALTSVAHPDFRAELQEAAERMFDAQDLSLWCQSLIDPARASCH